jgi:hypothetical protein
MREEFEKAFPVPRFMSFDESESDYFISEEIIGDLQWENYYKFRGAWKAWQAATALQAEEIERLSQCLAKANGHDDHVMDAFKYGTGFMQGGKRVDPKDVYLQDPQAERVRELEECLGHVMGAWEYDGISDEHGAIAMKADELISATAREVGE